MAKRGSGENSGVSMLALIRQVLVDGKVHTAKQISEHMQNFMFKGMSLDMVLQTVKNLLDNHSQIEKTPKGYRLKGGSNLSNIVRELIADALIPLTETEIKRLVAKKQGVPMDMIRLELDSDSKIASVAYKSRKYYYLSGRKNINDKVHKVLKDKNRPMTVEEVFIELESEKRFNREKVIFMPREETRIVKTGSKYTLKKKKKEKKAPAKPRHLVSRGEMERVIKFLENSSDSFTAEELAMKILDRPLDETNLRFKLARDQRLKRDDDRFYFETEEVEKETPEKVKERVNKEFYKVKARMMGSSELQTVNQLLDRIYGVNMAHQEVNFYQKELQEHLKQDDDTVLLLDRGWLLQHHEPRAQWVQPPEFEPVKLSDPKPPLQDEKITEKEREFLNHAEIVVKERSDNTIAIIVSPVDRLHGIADISKYLGTVFPDKPHAYEMLLRLPSQDISYEGFVMTEPGIIKGLEKLYSEHLPFEGGLMVLTPDSEKTYRFDCSFEEVSNLYKLSMEKINQIREMDPDQELPVLIQELFSRTQEKFLSCYQIWAEINLLRKTRREDILATLKDYNCFLPIKSMDGFYSFDKTGGSGRLSVAPEVQKEAPVPEKEQIEEAVVATETPVVEDAVTSQEAADEAKAKPAKAKKAKPKKETVKKRKKVQPEPVEEELPEHLRKLKDFERKLPKLRMTTSGKSARPAQQSPTRPTRISHVQPRKTTRHHSFAKPVRSVQHEEPKQVLVDIPAMPDKPGGWDTTSFINPDKGSGYADLHTAIEVLKAFVSREPQVRRTDGSIVLFLDNNDLAIYFRVPPENQDCWLAWIPETSLNSVKETQSWLSNGVKKAKKSDDGYWWATGKFKGPKGNFRDKNILESVEIVGKILELMDKPKK